MKLYEEPKIEFQQVEDRDILTASIGELRDTPDVNLSW